MPCSASAQQHVAQAAIRGNMQLGCLCSMAELRFSAVLFVKRHRLVVNKFVQQHRLQDALLGTPRDLDDLVTDCTSASEPVLLRCLFHTPQTAAHAS